MSKFLFTAAIFVSAFLLFLVQPMFARMALPYLGGAPSVWNTALVFYQGVLLLGYLYAHWAAKALDRGRWVWMHLGLMALAVLVLPIQLPMHGDPPSTSSPVLWLLGLLALGVGLPFFVVSTTSPLVQRWFSKIGHKQSDAPYFLYAASNIGSLVALIGYPLVFERLLTLRQQSLVWTIGYSVLILFLGGCAWKLTKSNAGEKPAPVTPEAVPLLRKLRWLGLAFVPSCLLMGVTTYITTEVAAAPLLWVVPLAIYLLTFILTFTDRRIFSQKWIRILTPLFIVLPLIATSGVYKELKIVALIAGFGGFFICSLFCHGELSDDKPSPGRLTEFFLILSAGGVLGGLFCGLLAPVVFKQVLEYPIALILCAILVPRTRIERSAWDFVLPAVTLVTGVASLMWLKSTDQWNEFVSWKAMLVPGVFAVLSVGKPVRLAVSVALLAGLPMFFGPIVQNRAYQSRSFFGTIIVRRHSDSVTLAHGTTLHGEQYNSPLIHDEPVSYYHRSGPIGDIIEKRKLPQRATVAVVGLGVGTMIAYAQPDQHWTFYEIDPDIVKVASDPQFFTYLSSHKGQYHVVVGDARLKLAQSHELYDLIVLDAYSSDAVPIHLITLEAFRSYLDKLRPEGVLAVHISNRYMDLWPVVTSAAHSLGAVELRREDREKDIFHPEKQPSNWIAVCKAPADFGVLNKDPHWVPDVVPAGFQLWTDERSSLLEVLKGSPWNLVKP